MKATIINQCPLRLITSKSKKFPEGNKAAFDALESPLSTLQGRKFYGLAYSTADGMDYYAGLVPADEAEERRFGELGFSITEVAGGPYARVKLHDWSSKLDQLAPTFRRVAAEYGRDPSRPEMEYYRSLTELHLLLPVPS